MDEQPNGAALASPSLKKFYEARKSREVSSLQSEEWLNANRHFIKTAFQHSYFRGHDMSDIKSKILSEGGATKQWDVPAGRGRRDRPPEAISYKSWVLALCRQ